MRKVLAAIRGVSEAHCVLKPTHDLGGKVERELWGNVWVTVWLLRNQGSPKPRTQPVRILILDAPSRIGDLDLSGGRLLVSRRAERRNVKWSVPITYIFHDGYYNGDLEFLDWSFSPFDPPSMRALVGNVETWDLFSPTNRRLSPHWAVALRMRKLVDGPHHVGALTGNQERLNAEAFQF
ncbi:hypothetical protein SODALDRAFT_356414 [Sodiomyces alkalinus F11]|uniref:Uncharacterized protein n=1 Tax=Sodiomyces alkalinus (strain CBS 110278 / VKM F-3762 / F11) TaxID=1314773 RepID=A0A3N2Q108_SODAK|nr:hypothetical protein SODALDRAFT_356414 [Sodiomyces alkalinus F11]ROT40430.1 hypothetical protein SODALDRAFT_356414 [Sodiomyces alkalinus F11]